MRAEPTVLDRFQLRLGRGLDLLPPGLKLALSGRGTGRVGDQRLEPGIALLLRMMDINGENSLTHGSTDVEMIRRKTREGSRIVGQARTEVGAVENFTIPGAEGAMNARLYRPAELMEPAPLLLYAHGGGFIVGDLDSHQEPCRILCRHGHLNVLAFEYRLAPEHPYPAALEDTVAALEWATGAAASLGVDPDRIALGGDSAGGHLTAAACQRTAGEQHCPVLQVLIYPGLDAHEQLPSHHEFAEGFFLTREDIRITRDLYIPADVERTDPGVSPIRAESLEGQPPAVIVTAAFDPLRDEGELYAQRLRDAGVPVIGWREPGLIHGYLNFTNVNRASLDATIGLAATIRAALAGLA